MVVGRNNGVVGLTGFSDNKMSGLSFGPQKSGRNNGVVVWRGSTVEAEMSDEENGNNTDIDRIEATIAAGATLSSPVRASISRSFNDQQDNALEDYLEASVMIRYNKKMQYKEAVNFKVYDL